MTCNLTPTPEDPSCDMHAAAAVKTTLRLKGRVGSVKFLKGQYNGTEIPGLPAAELSLVITAGSSDLDLVYVFSDPISGRGTLSEVCDKSTTLALVNAATPAVQYTICCP